MRPVTVTAAATITVVFAALGVVVSLIAIGNIPAAADPIFEVDPLFGDPGVGRASLVGAFVFGIAIAVFTVVLAVLTLARRNWARIVLTVLLGLVMAWNLPRPVGTSLVSILLPGLVLALYWLPVSNVYFRQRS